MCFEKNSTYYIATNISLFFQFFCLLTFSFFLIFNRIDSELQVRVSDTALARDLFPQDYHCLGDNENRSVKWLSLEALIHKQFTPANDVVNRLSKFT